MYLNVFFFHASRQLFTCIDLELKKKQKEKNYYIYTAKAMCNDMVTGAVIII